MHKTTVYLPDELKTALEHAAATTQQSEAELIRKGIRLVTQEYALPVPIRPLFASGNLDLAECVDAALTGFGER